MARRRVPLRIALFAAWLGLSVPLLLELAVRIWLAASLSDPGLLRFPAGGKLGAAEVATEGRMVKSDAADFPFTDRWVDHGFQHETPLNRDGFRGVAPSDPRTTRWRVAFLGGSSTFSPECGEGRTWPDRLGARIAEGTGDDVAVLNMGRVGWSTADIAPLWDRWAPVADADLVVVTAGYNNLATIGIVDLRPGVAPLHQRLLWGRSLAWTWAWNSWQVRRQERFGGFAVAAARYARDLESIVRAARAQDTAVLFNLQPMLAADQIDPRERALTSGVVSELIEAAKRDRPALDRLLDVMVQVGAELDVPVVDAREAVTAGPDVAEHFHVFLHLSEEGAPVFAQGIDARVAERPGGWAALMGTR